jgi:hypothetical protein
MMVIWCANATARRYAHQAEDIRVHACFRWLRPSPSDKLAAQMTRVDQFGG